MSTDKITIASFNCQGLGGREKRKDVLNFLKQKSYSILCLQDTHFTEKEENYIRSQWGFDCIFNSYNSQSRGTAIFFNNNFEYKVLSTRKDNNGNKIVFEIEMHGKKFTFINIYGPNTDTPNFFEEIKQDIISLGNDNIIWSGDFNLVMDPLKDTKNYLHVNNPRSRETVLDICTEFDLIDIWRELNIEKSRFTWRTNNGNKHGRLDLFLISHNLFNIVSNADIEYGYKSDHSIINFTIKGEDIERDKPFWKFNNSLLKDRLYMEQIKHIISETKIQYAEPNQNIDINNNANLKFTINDQIFFEMLLMNIRGKTISFASHKKKQTNQKEKELIEELNKLGENEVTNKAKIDEKQTELKEIRENKLEGLKIRSRAQWVDQGEKVTNYFCNLEKRNYTSKLMPDLIKQDGSKTQSQEEIVTETRLFYEKLYSERETSNINLDEKLGNMDIPKLNVMQKNNLEGNISKQEAAQALKNMKNNKSPGSDGFTTEFFKFFWVDIGDFFVRSINFSFNKGELSTTQKEGLITCIPKGGKDKQFLKNWRPISLLNVTYKLASACIANRLKSILPFLINDDQTGFIQGRFIGDNTRKLYDILQYTEQNQIPGLLLLIDFEKAFDSISWSFIEKTLIFFNFGNDIVRWVSTFYKNIKSCILANGKISPWFHIGRGCRQGDPLSPYIFIICAEILAIMIRNEKNIKGVKIGNEEHLISQYADDTTLTLDATEKSLKFALKILKFYAEASGLRINIEKTKVIWFGSKKGSNEIMLENENLCWEEGSFKVLGINFSVNLNEINNLNYPDKIQEIKSLLINWSKRVLTPYGKITVIKSLALSKINHLFISLPDPPENFIKDLESMFFKFIWNKSPDKIKRDILVKDYKDGGLNMIKISPFINASKISWFRRILNGNNKWINILEQTFGQTREIFIYGAEFLKTKMNNVKNLFWKDVLTAWTAFCEKLSISTWEEFLTQPLWYNSNMKVGGQPVSYQNYISKNIIHVSDLLDENGQFYAFEQIRNILGIDTNFLQYHGLLQSIRMFKNSLNIEEEAVNIQKPIYPLSIALLMKHNKGNKLVYKKLLENNVTPNAEEKWQTELQLEYGFNWYHVYNTLQNISVDSNLKWFQYRLIHRILATNKLLKTIGLRNDDSCTFCLSNCETISHLFYDCNLVQVFWQTTLDWIKQKCTSLGNVVLSKKEIILSLPIEGTNDTSLAWILLIAKKYIYYCRISNNTPDLQIFKKYSKTFYETDKHIAFTNCDWNAFNKKWSKYKSLFENG